MFRASQVAMRIKEADSCLRILLSLAKGISSIGIESRDEGQISGGKPCGPAQGQLVGGIKEGGGLSDKSWGISRGRGEIKSTAIVRD